MYILNWIEKWYSSQCDGHWEHNYGIKIDTLDNPGWDVVIDVENTDLEGLEVPYELFEKSDTDWYGIKVEKNKFEAFGDPSKLEFLLSQFRELAENSTSDRPADAE